MWLSLRGVGSICSENVSSSTCAPKQPANDANIIKVESISTSGLI
jgi:adenine-specific DNA glycosylase